MLEKQAPTVPSVFQKPKETYFESCVIPEFMFLEDFDRLADPQENQRELLRSFRKIIPRERFLLDRQRFAFLMEFTLAQTQSGLRNKALSIILIYVKFGKEILFNMAPPNFIDIIYSMLPQTRAIQILIEIAKMDLSISARLIELGICNFLGEHLKKGDMLSKYVLSFSKVFMSYAELQELMAPFIDRILEFSVTIQRHSDRQIRAIDTIRVISRFSPAYRLHIINSQYFMQIFQTQTRRISKRHAMLRLACELIENDRILALQFTGTPVWPFVLDSLNLKEQKLYTQIFLYFYYLARSEDGRKVIAETGLIDPILFIIQNIDFNVKNEGLRVLCRLCCSSNIAILQCLVSKGFLDILGCSLSSLKKSVQIVALDAISNLINVAETGNIRELLQMVFENGMLMDEINVLQDSEDDEIYGLARNIYYNEMNYTATL